MAHNPMLPMMRQTVTLERKTGVNSANEALYGTGAPLLCMQDSQPRRVQMADGTLIIAQDTLYCPPGTGLQNEDRVTLPGGRTALIRQVGQTPGARGEVWAEVAALV